MDWTVRCKIYFFSPSENWKVAFMNSCSHRTKTEHVRCICEFILEPDKKHRTVRSIGRVVKSMPDSLTFFYTKKSEAWILSDDPADGPDSPVPKCYRKAHKGNGHICCLVSAQKEFLSIVVLKAQGQHSCHVPQLWTVKISRRFLVTIKLMLLCLYGLI